MHIASRDPNRHLAVAAALLALALCAGTATADDRVGIQIPRDTYFGLVRGTDHGLTHDPQSADGGDHVATRGTLHDRDGNEVGRFTVVWADELDSVARVEALAPGMPIDAVDHAAVESLGLHFLTIQPQPSDRYVRLDRGWASAGGASLQHGGKGVLTTADGRVGALVTIVSVGSNSTLARITEYSQGVFNRDLTSFELRGYWNQVVSGTGFANLTWLNALMLVIGGLFIYLAIAKDYEPLLLVPIGFGILIGNIPVPLQIFNAISVYMIDPVTHEYTFNTTTNSVMGMIYFLVRTGLLPPLIFLGIGTLTDFSALLSNPKAVLLGAAAQVGIFITFLGALALGFSPANSAAIGIIGGADGPTAIFLASRLAPSLIGPIAIAAYSYMAMVPIIQPPIMKLLTTHEERCIRMKPGRKVATRDKILFPIAGMLVTTLVAPGGLPLLGMLFFGNLLKESGVTGRLAKTAGSAVLDTATILLGVAVGASTSAQVFLTPQSVGIFVLGCVAFATATAGGVLFAKLMNLFVTDKVNPLIGAAGVSAVPDSARVAHIVGQEADPTNYLLQHAMGPNVAGVIGSAIAAGVFLGVF